MKTFLKTYKYTCDKCGKFFRIKREYCRVCGSHGLRKAKKDDYKKLDKRMMIEVKEDLQNRAQFKANLDKLGEILQALAKNDAEYKNLLKTKNPDESVEYLIAKNRRYYEKLKKEDKEHCEISKKWMRTEEGEKTIKRMFMRASLNPNFRIKNEQVIKMVAINKKIQKNKEEYENILERKNRGDYVDDLIKQNRYAAESLKQSKKTCEKAMSELRTEKKSDWKSKIVR